MKKYKDAPKVALISKTLSLKNLVSNNSKNHFAKEEEEESLGMKKISSTNSSILFIHKIMHIFVYHTYRAPIMDEIARYNSQPY